MLEKDKLRILGSSDILKDRSCALLVNDTHSNTEIRYLSNYFANELNIRFEKIIFISASEEISADRIVSENEDKHIIITGIDNLLENIIELLPTGISAIVDATEGGLINWSYRKALATKVLVYGISYIGSDFAFFPRKSQIDCPKPIIAIYGFYDSLSVLSILILIQKLFYEYNWTSCIIKLTEKGSPHPRVVNSTHVKSPKELLNLMRHRSEEDQEIIIESLITGSKIIGCISIGDGMTGKPFYSLINDSVILANSFEEQILMLETSNIIKPISITDLNIISISNNKDIESNDEMFLESKIFDTDLIIFTESIGNNTDKNRYRKVKRTLKEVLPKSVKFIDTFTVPVMTKDISGRNVLLIKGIPSDAIKTFSNYVRKKYKPKTLNILTDINKKNYEKIAKIIKEKKIDIVIIEYGKIDIDFIKNILSTDLDVGFLYYEFNPEDKKSKTVLKKSVDLALKRFNSRITT